jgi:Zn finger protein HypA/HybF involved in hydrogenase expression
MGDPTIVILFGLVVTIVWLVIGWRAMKAHERIANSLEDLLRGSSLPSVSLFTLFPTSENCPRCGYTIPPGTPKCPNCGGQRAAR